MDIRKALLKEHSKEQTMKIVQYLGSDATRVAELMDIFLTEDYRLNQRSSWVIHHLSEKNPYLLKPYLPQMVEKLEKPSHDAVIRNTLRYFERITLPEDLMGPVANICFEFLASPEKPIAIRVFAMGTLYEISRTYPELQPELALIIEEHLPYGSAGFKSRGKRILKKIKKNAQKRASG